MSSFDRTVDRAFERLRGHRAADRVLYAASELGDHGLIWLILGAALGLRTYGLPPDIAARRHRGALRLVAGIPIESAIVNGGLKLLFRRSRPVLDLPRPRRLRIPITSSFPSGHASSAFFSASLLAEADPGFAPVYWALAVVIAASRIHVQIHHASDVAGGAATGALLGYVARRVAPLDGVGGIWRLTPPLADS